MTREVKNLETFLALFAAIGIVATLYFFFGAIFLRASAGRVVTVVEGGRDGDISSLVAAWISSFLVRGEVLVLPEDREKAFLLLEKLAKRGENADPC
ncbi:MAG: hypothetical protein J5849_04615 [Clostridia bacterium]|nr:hypothetical protein [Clostridia bacterium]